MSTGKPKEGLAITSLVLGILSLIPPLMLLLGIPAIVTGHLARRRARKLPEQYAGRKLALAGLITGYVGMAFALGIVISLLTMISRVNQMQTRSTSDRCLSNLKEIGLAARVFSEANKYQFPDSFLQMSNELGRAGILVCPADTNHVARGGRSGWSETNITYEFVAPGIQETPDVMNNVAFRCPIHGHEVTVGGSLQPGTSSPPPRTGAGK
jgi:hypothetical protein